MAKRDKDSVIATALPEGQSAPVATIAASSSPPNRWLTPLLFWLAGIGMLCFVWLQGYVFGDSGDGIFVNFVLEHQYRVLFDHDYPGTYSTGPFWHSFPPGNMAYSDLMTGVAPFYILPRLVLGREAAYQTFFFIVCSLNFWIFLLLLRRFGAALWPASLASFIYAFGAHKRIHFIHAQLMAGFWGILGIAFLLLFLRRPSRTRFLIAVAGFALQCLSSPYAGLFFALGAFAVVAFFALFERDNLKPLLIFLRGEWLSLIGATALVGVPTLLLAIPYLRLIGKGNFRAWWEVAMFLPEPWFWIYPLRGTLWSKLLVPVWPGLPAIATDSQFLGSVGLLLLTLAIVALVYRKDWRNSAAGRTALILLCSSIVLLLITAKLPGGGALWKILYDHVPGFSGIRDIRRVSVVVNVFWLAAGALALTALLPSSVRLRRGTLAALTLLALVENFAPLKTGAHRPANWYAAESQSIATLMNGASSAYIYTNPREAPYATETTAQLLAQELRVPVINGHSGTQPAGFHYKMTPQEILRRGAHFDFHRFRFILPESEFAALKPDLDLAGMREYNRAGGFVAYTVWDNSIRHGVDAQVLVDTPVTARPGQTIRIGTLLVNRSNFAWQSTGAFPVSASCQVFDVSPGNATPHTPVSDCGRTPLPEVLLPGERAFVSMPVLAPAKAGSYVVRTGVVHELQAWTLAPPNSSGSFTLHVQP